MSLIIKAICNSHQRCILKGNQQKNEKTHGKMLQPNASYITSTEVKHKDVFSDIFLGFLVSSVLFYIVYFQESGPKSHSDLSSHSQTCDW